MKYILIYVLLFIFNNAFSQEKEYEDPPVFKQWSIKYIDTSMTSRKLFRLPLILYNNDSSILNINKIDMSF